MGIAGGLSVKEALLSVPGEVYDILEVKARAGKKEKKQDDDFE